MTGTSRRTAERPCALHASRSAPWNGPRMPIEAGGSSPGQAGMAPIEAPFTVRLPSPMPRGVPAGGLFQQTVLQPNESGGEELSPDSIAVDSSSLVPIADAPPAVAVALRGVGVDSAAGRASAMPPEFDVVRPATIASPGPGPIERPDGSGRERAELPDLLAPEPTAGPATPGPIEEGSGRMGRSSDAMSDLGAGEDVIPETRRGDHRLTVKVAIYGVASLMLGVSAPGLIAAAWLADEMARGRRSAFNGIRCKPCDRPTRRRG